MQYNPNYYRQTTFVAVVTFAALNYLLQSLIVCSDFPISAAARRINTWFTQGVLWSLVLCCWACGLCLEITHLSHFFILWFLLPFHHSELSELYVAGVGHPAALCQWQLLRQWWCWGGCYWPQRVCTGQGQHPHHFTFMSAIQFDPWSQHPLSRV